MFVYLCKMKHKDKPEANGVGHPWGWCLGIEWRTLQMGTGQKGCGGSGTSQNIHLLYNLDF